MRIPLALIALLVMSAVALPAQGIIRTLQGPSDNDGAGAALAGVGDFDNDGTPDLAVGAPAHDAGGGADQGRVQVISGANAAVLFTGVGAALGDRYGAALSMGGDIDNDGFDDVMIGAPMRDAGLGAEQGEVVIISGQTGLPLFTLAGATAGDRYGASVAIIGDVNGDSLDDWAIGAPLFDGVAGADSGRITVYNAATGLELYSVEGANAGDFYGTSVGATGDSNNDGNADLVVGIPAFAGTAGAASGRIAILDGPTGAEIQSAEGSQAGAELGTAVAGAGDLDLDGRGDAVAGGPLFDGVAGADSGLVVVVAAGDGSTLLSFEGADAGGQLGGAVSGNGDVNGDGLGDVVAGAALFDGTAGLESGRCVVLSGLDGSVLFAVEGAAAGDHQGTGVAVAGPVDLNPRADIATGAPDAAGVGIARGEISIVESDSIATTEVNVFPTAGTPQAITQCDVDADGDLDLVTVGGATLSIHWNGDQAGATPTADFGQVLRTDVALTPGATAVSVAAGELDADSACEIIVGRSDGTVDIIDGTGSGATVMLALTPSSPFTVDGRAGTGPIASVAILGSGATGSVVCAAAGNPVLAGFVDTITDPMGAPALGGQLVSGGSFQDIEIVDIDNDLDDDLVVINNSTGPSGGIHVLEGPGFTAATGSPFAAGVAAQRLTVCDLDGDDILDDVAVASINLTAGGVRVLPDYVAGVGFGAGVDLGLLLARDVSRANLEATDGDDLAVLDAAGDVVRFIGWNGAGFDSQLTSSLADGAGVALTVAQLTVGGPDRCETDEIATVHLATDLLGVLRTRRPFNVALVANTGCPFAAPTSFVGLNEDAVIGQPTLTVGLTGATPLSLAFLVAQLNDVPGTPPMVDTTSGCGIAMTGGDLTQFSTFTDFSGDALIAAGLPDDPCIIGTEFLLQWGVIDGGPLLGMLSASDAVLMRIGEN